MKKIKAVLLDLGGVVFQSTGISNNIINWEVISRLNEKYGYDFNIGNDVFPNFMQEYNELTNQTLSGEDFLRQVFDTLEMNRELIEMLQKHYKIIIVSDNYRENIAYISKRYQFDSWAIQQFYSFDYKMEKANPLFFQRLLNDLMYSKGEIIYIDDSPRKLDSAKKSGISGILYSSNEQVKIALSKLLS